MNENDARALFLGAAEVEPAPSQVDVARAMSQGRRTLRTRRLVAVAAAAVAVAVLVGGGVAGAALFTAKRAQEPVDPVVTPTSAPPSSAPPPAGRPFCQVSLPPQWTAALSSPPIAREPDESLNFVAASGDGNVLFAESVRGDARSLVQLTGPDYTRHTVQPIDRQQLVVYAAFTDPWLVFSVADGPTGISTWTMYAWNATTTKAPRAIGHSAATELAPQPIVVDAAAFWVQEVGSGQRQLHKRSLSGDSDLIVDSGPVDPPMSFGGTILWTTRGTDKSTVHAAGATSGQPTALPPGVPSEIALPWSASGSRDGFAWATNNPSALTAYRDGDPNATTILVTAPGQTGFVQYPKISRDLVSFDNGAAQFIADLRSGSYAQVTTEWGGVLLGDDVILVQSAPAGGKDRPIWDTRLLRPSQLPHLPTC
jgi:hypothetical protein